MSIGPPAEQLGHLHALLGRLVRSESFLRGDTGIGLAELTEAASSALGVERASVWRFREDETSLVCLDLFERTPAQHSAGSLLKAIDNPHYFAALRSARAIAAHDAQADPRTREFTPHYLVPHRITSMLDTPIVLDGRLTGVFCHEHVGARRDWTPWEELLAGTFADLVALLLGSAAREEQARSLLAHRDQLERRVEERAAQLRATEDSFRKLFEAAPVALVLTHRTSGKVLAVNGAMTRLFGFSREQIIGRSAVDFYVQPEDREQLLSEVDAHGLVDGFETSFRAATGRVFDGAVSVDEVTVAGERALFFAIRDVTAQRQSEVELRQSREMLRTLLSATPMAMVVVTLTDSRVRYDNAVAARLFDCGVQDLVGRGVPELFENVEDWNRFRERLERGEPVEGLVVRVKTLHDRGFWALVNARSVDLDGERVCLAGFADLTEQKRVEERLWQLSNTDPLTGLLNRRRVFEIGDEEVLRANRYARPFTVVMIDLDRFKDLNDRFGHELGDEVLKRVSRILRQEVRAQDTVGRYGGEELVVLMPETTLDAGKAVAERVRRAIAELSLPQGEEQVTVTASLGVAAVEVGDSLGQVLRRADAALYAAKRGGRNQVAVER